MPVIEKCTVSHPPSAEAVFNLFVNEWSTNKRRQIVALTIEAAGSDTERQIQFELSTRPRVTEDGAMMAFGFEATAEADNRKKASRYILKAEVDSQERAELSVISPTSS